jgi:hypothetical protein
VKTACLWILRLSTALLLAGAWMAVTLWMINSFAP